MTRPLTLAAERHRRLREVFDHVLPMDAATRTQHVEEAFGDDSELRSRCLELLTALDAARSFLEVPIGRPPDLVDPPSTKQRPLGHGSRVGPRR